MAKWVKKIGMAVFGDRFSLQIALLGEALPQAMKRSAFFAETAKEKAQRPRGTRRAAVGRSWTGF